MPELRSLDAKLAQAFRQDLEALQQSRWENRWGFGYGQEGKYAEVVDRPPHGTKGPPTGPIPLFFRDDDFKVHLANGAHWAAASELGAGPSGDLCRLVRQRFGGVIAIFDF